MQITQRFSSLVKPIKMNGMGLVKKEYVKTEAIKTIYVRSLA
jgi:hypothetical protein